MTNSNFIEIYDNAISDNICDYLISIFDRENMMTNSDVYQAETLAGNVPSMLSSKGLILDETNYLYNDIIEDINSVLQEYLFRYSDKYNINKLERLGYWKIKKYKAPDDGYYAWHADWGATPKLIQRVLAVQVYLNDVEEGGETSFHHYNLKVKPKKGSLVIWPSSFTHIHKGEKPISNDKYTLSIWMKQNNSHRETNSYE